ILIACENGHVEVVKLLLDNGASVNEVDEDGDCPLFVAAGNGHADIVKCLLEHGAATELVNNAGWSA
ncbi:hypothetical protein PHYSODRAFT_435214, partial [Phytophthora sojae]